MKINRIIVEVLDYNTINMVMFEPYEGGLIQACHTEVNDYEILALLRDLTRDVKE